MAEVETIKNPAPEVYARWKKGMEKVVGKNNVSSAMSSSIEKAPFARLFMMGNPTHGMDLANNESSQRISFQTEVFAKGQTDITDAYAYDDESHKLMVAMGFRRTYGAELIDNVDSSIKRVVSRYSRVYTGIL